MCLSNDSVHPRQLTQLVYVSSPTSAFDVSTLKELLVDFRQRNQKANITGLLLYRNGTFFQIIEGPTDQVKGLYQRIGRDPRHSDVLLIHEQTTSYRIFPQWQMGFVTDQTIIESLEGFCDFFACHDGTQRTFLDLAGNQQTIAQILNGFRRGRWSRQPLAPAIPQLRPIPGAEVVAI